MKKYTNPNAAGYLLEAEACKIVLKELERVAEKMRRRIERQDQEREKELQTVMEYRNEREIQDAYGYDLISDAQYERYLELFRRGREVLEDHVPTKSEVAVRILNRITGELMEEVREWEFAALTPKEQAAELERAQKSKEEWKKKMEKIKEEYGLISAKRTEEVG